MRRLLVACLLLGACGTGTTRVSAERGRRESNSLTSVLETGPAPPPRPLDEPIVPPTTAPTTTIPVPEPTTTTTEPPRPPVTAASRSRGALNWEGLRQCESGGDYSTNTGNGYFGAYQFDARTWQGLGYEGLPSDAPPETQDEAAQRLYTARGASPWPQCGPRL